MLAATLQVPHELELCEKTEPHTGPGEVVLKVETGTLCDTGYRLFIGAKTAGMRYGVVPGHELADRIADIGEDVDAIQLGLTFGQQATTSIMVSYGRYQNCLHDREHLCSYLELFSYITDGGLQEYLVVPRCAAMRDNLITTNQELLSKALCLVEPISHCLNALDHLQVKPGGVVAVLGAGPIGLLHIQPTLAYEVGRVYVSNRSGGRRAVADRLDAAGVASEESNPQVRVATAGAGIDIVAVRIGASELTRSTLGLATIGGRVNFFAGLPKGPSAATEPDLTHYKELQVTGGPNAGRRDAKRAIVLLESGAINVAEIATYEFPLPRVVETYEAMNQRVSMKIAVIPD